MSFLIFLEKSQISFALSQDLTFLVERPVSLHRLDMKALLAYLYFLKRQRFIAFLHTKARRLARRERQRLSCKRLTAAQGMYTSPNNCSIHSILDWEHDKDYIIMFGIDVVGFQELLHSYAPLYENNRITSNCEIRYL